MFSHFFIHRPVFAGVVAIIIVLGGLVASQILPVSQFPEIAPPMVIINTTYPGASAETVSRTVAAPIEEQLSGVENLSYFNSTSSSNGALSVLATFEPGTNVDQAIFNVNNRVQDSSRPLHGRCRPRCGARRPCCGKTHSTGRSCL